MSESKDEDLLKIQIVSERCHTLFTTKSSLIFGALIGFMILFYTLYYGGTFSPLVFWVSLSGWTVGCVFFMWRILKTCYRNMKKISVMIEKVKLGEELPPLEEIDITKKTEKAEKVKKISDEQMNVKELSNGSKFNMKDLLLLIQGVLIAFILQIFYDTLREAPFYQNIAPTEVWRSVLAVICLICFVLIFHYFKKHS